MKQNIMHRAYNALNYNILLNVEPVYIAGNNPMSSDVSDTLPEAQRVGLERMKENCLHTLQEMCFENNCAVNAGIKHKNILDPKELWQ